MRQRIGIAVHAVKSAARYFGIHVGNLVSAAGRAVLKVLKLPFRWSVATWTLVLTVLILLLMLRQIDLAERQTTLAQRQTEIIEKQEALLARRAELVVRVSDKATVNGRVSLQLVVQNGGRRTADNYQYEVFVPQSASPEFSSLKNSMLEPGVGTVPVDGVQHKRVIGYSYAPLYPKRYADMFRIEVPKPPKGGRASFALLWEVIAEDGVFPGSEVVNGKTKPGRLLIEVQGD
jgi:hypothetical protein